MLERTDGDSSVVRCASGGRGWEAVSEDVMMVAEIGDGAGFGVAELHDAEGSTGMEANSENADEMSSGHVAIPTKSCCDKPTEKSESGNGVFSVVMERDPCAPISHISALDSPVVSGGGVVSWGRGSCRSSLCCASCGLWWNGG